MLKYLLQFHLKENCLTCRKYHLARLVSQTSYQPEPVKLTLDSHRGCLLEQLRISNFMAPCNTTATMKVVHRATVDIMAGVTR